MWRFVRRADVEQRRGHTIHRNRNAAQNIPQGRSGRRSDSGSQAVSRIEINEPGTNAAAGLAPTQLNPTLPSTS